MVQQPPGGTTPQPPSAPPPGVPPAQPRPQLDTSALPIPDIIVAAGALITWIFTMLSWYRVELFGIIGASGRGSYQWWPFIIYLFLMLFAGFIIAKELTNFVQFELPTGIIYLAWGVAGTIFTLLAFVIRPGDWTYVKMNWAIWILSIIFSLVPIVGGAMKIQRQ